MKRIYSALIPISILIFSVFSCTNNDQLEPDFISAKLNNQNWKGLPEININSVNDTLILLGIGNEQVVSFKIKNNGKGVYKLSGTQANYYTTIGGDVITSLYTLGDTSSSQITITEYNSELNIIKGNFQVMLFKEWSNPVNNNDILSFTQGQFKGTLAK